MKYPEPNLVAPESIFETEIFEISKKLILQAGRQFVSIRRFGLDLAFFLKTAHGTCPRFLETKIFSESAGRIGFGNSKGQGIQVDILSLKDDDLELLNMNVRWILADTTLATGTERYAFFDCYKARESTMGRVENGKQNNFNISRIQDSFMNWSNLLNHLELFLLS
jgi:hypothetical protein